MSDNGYYHNMKFKAAAEAHGLNIEKHPKYGGTITTLAMEAESWIRSVLGDTSIHASRPRAIGGSKGGREKSTNRSIKYIFP